MASPADVPVMTALDIGVLVALGVGALIGLALGFIRAGLFAVSWVGAIGATIYGFPYAQPFARQWIETELFADLAAGVAVFVVVLVTLFVISSVIGDWVRSSRLNAVDRSLGVLAGLAATSLLVVGAYLIAVSVWTIEDRPKWMREARSMTLIEPAAVLFLSLLPENLGAGKDKATPGKAGADQGRKKVILDLMAPKPRRPGGPAPAPSPNAPNTPSGTPGSPPASAPGGAQGSGDSGVYDGSQRRQMERLHDSIQRQ